MDSLGIRRCGRERRMWKYGEKGRDRTRTGRGAGRNVLGLNRHEDMATLTALFLFSHRQAVEENIWSRERLDQDAQDCLLALSHQSCHFIHFCLSCGFLWEHKALKMNCLQSALDEGSLHLHEQRDRFSPVMTADQPQGGQNTTESGTEDELQCSNGHTEHYHLSVLLATGMMLWVYWQTSPKKTSRDD